MYVFLRSPSLRCLRSLTRKRSRHHTSQQILKVSVTGGRVKKSVPYKFKEELSAF